VRIVQTAQGKVTGTSITVNFPNAMTPGTHRLALIAHSTDQAPTVSDGWTFLANSVSTGVCRVSAYTSTTATGITVTTLLNNTFFVGLFEVDDVTGWALVDAKNSTVGATSVTLAGTPPAGIVFPMVCSNQSLGSVGTRTIGYMFENLSDFVVCFPREWAGGSYSNVISWASSVPYAALAVRAAASSGVIALNSHSSNNSSSSPLNIGFTAQPGDIVVASASVAGSSLGALSVPSVFQPIVTTGYINDWRGGCWAFVYKPGDTTTFSVSCPGSVFSMFGHVDVYRHSSGKRITYTAVGQTYGNAINYAMPNGGDGRLHRVFGHYQDSNNGEPSGVVWHAIDGNVNHKLYNYESLNKTGETLSVSNSNNAAFGAVLTMTEAKRIGQYRTRLGRFVRQSVRSGERVLSW
jgi:hypothetical protein